MAWSRFVSGICCCLLKTTIKLSDIVHNLLFLTIQCIDWVKLGSFSVLYGTSEAAFNWEVSWAWNDCKSILSSRVWPLDIYQFNDCLSRGWKQEMPVFLTLGPRMSFQLHSSKSWDQGFMTEEKDSTFDGKGGICVQVWKEVLIMTYGVHPSLDSATTIHISPTCKNAFISSPKITSHYEISSKFRTLSPRLIPVGDKAPQGQLFRCWNFGAVSKIKYMALALWPGSWQKPEWWANH